MDRLWPRRSVLKTALMMAAGLTVLPNNSDSQPQNFRFEDTELTELELDGQKTAASNRLTEAIFSQPSLLVHNLEYDFKDLKHLPLPKARTEMQKRIAESSKISVVRPQEAAALIGDVGPHLTTLAREIPLTHRNTTTGKMEGVGMFIYGDTQTGYLLRKNSDNTVSIEKKFPVSTATTFGNIVDSGATATGLVHIAEKREGLPLEVISTLKKRPEHYTYLNIRGVSRPFLKSRFSKLDSIAAIITKAALLIGPQCPVTRGEYFHVANRQDRTGLAGTSGCTRADELAMEILWPDFVAGEMLPNGKGVSSKRPATPIFIYKKGEASLPESKLGLPKRKNIDPELLEKYK